MKSTVRFLLLSGISGLLIAAATGCLFRGKITKVFAGGDPDMEEQPTPRKLTKDDGTDVPAIANPAPLGRRMTVPGDQREKNGLSLSFRIPSPEVVAGNDVIINVALRNTSSMVQPLTYNSDQRFDVFIYADPDQMEPVFVWSSTQEFNDNFTPYRLSAGANISRTFEIPTTRDTVMGEELAGDPRRPLPPGTYYVFASHESDPFLGNGPLQIRVTPPGQRLPRPVD